MADARVLFASAHIGPGLLVSESQQAGAPHLQFVPTSDKHARLGRGEVERLYEELGRWLGR